MIVKNKVDALTTLGNMLPRLRETLEDFAKEINEQGSRIKALEARGALDNFAAGVASKPAEPAVVVETETDEAEAPATKEESEGAE